MPDPLSPPDPAGLMPVVGKHCTKIVSALPAQDTERVLSVMGEAGLLPFLEKHPLGSIDVAKGTRITMHPLNPKQPLAAVDGEYVGGNLFVNAGKRASGGNFFNSLGQAWAPGPPGCMTPDDFARTAENRVEAGRRTCIHEVGHHVFTVGNGGNRLDQNGTVMKIVSAAFLSGARNPLTDYATRNEHEYFSECFALYVFDRHSLKTFDPVGFAMVQEVLRLPQVGLLHPLP